MKKIFVTLTAVILLFSMTFMTACNAGTQNELQDKVDELQSQLAEMNDRLAEMEAELRERDERIEQLEKELEGMQDFVLKISADKESYTINEEILIDITFENRSGEDVEIAYYFLFIPESPTGQFPAYELPPVTTKKTFKNGETIRRTERLGGYFPVGEHELTFRAVFYLSWEMTEFGFETTDDTVEVYSNAIEIAIVES